MSIKRYSPVKNGESPVRCGAKFAEGRRLVDISYVSRRIVAVGLLAVGLLAVTLASLPTLSMRAAAAPRMINLSGKTITSIYEDEAPRKRFGLAIRSVSTHHAPQACNRSRNAVYHPDTDPAQFQRIQTCVGYYFEQEYRACGSDDCGGGSESTVIQSSHVPCGTGQELDHNGCVDHCSEETVCENDCDDD
jgi:hypothetical protein